MMNEFSSGTKLQVFVVGGSTDEFVRQIMDMPGSGNIEFVFCEDVYSAAGRLAKSNCQGNAIVIGRIEQLSREQGRFLQIAYEKGYTCYCIAERDLVRKQKQILNTIRAGASIISSPAELLESEKLKTIA